MHNSSNTENNLELSTEFKEAYKIMNESSDSVFITGKAGAGESTLLLYFCQHTKKNYAVLAPTGVAALNVDVGKLYIAFLPSKWM